VGNYLHTQDEVLVEIHNSHKMLQQQFKDVHKQVDKLRSEPTRPGEIKQEIATLEDERKQLIMKIERLKKQTATEDGFAPLLAATTALRQQQDEDARLGENRRRQLMTLQHARQRHEDASKRLQALKSSQVDIYFFILDSIFDLTALL
jgi:intraflagellar transport protein 81